MFFGGREEAMKRAAVLSPNHIVADGTRWRMRGEEMRTLAEEALDPSIRTMMLRMAAGYDRLAQHADDQIAEEIEDERQWRTAAPAEESL
jgi:hypothetical protein